MHTHQILASPREPKTRKDITTPFLWRTHGGVRLLPSEMVTTHLFNSLRMLWNNLCPVGLKVADTKSWRLNMSPAYMRQAVKAFTAELATRADLTSDMLTTIAWMAQHANKLALH